MITLKTLPMATEQEVFDQVARHLLTQDEKSWDADLGGCVYRGPNGLKCAAGCLIADDEYSQKEFEICAWLDLVEFGLAPDAHADLIADLQDVHDVWPPDYWSRKLRNVAYKYSLEYKEEEYTK